MALAKKKKSAHKTQLVKDTGTRAVPVQKRSEETLQKILDSAMNLLESEGIAGFNTNAVAKVAGVNVGTLYHYFSDKNSLLAEMFLRSESERVDYLSKRLESFGSAQDLYRWIHETLGALMKMRWSTPGATNLRNAVRVLPNLQTLGEEQDERSARALSEALRARYPDISKTRADAAGRMLIDIGVSALDKVGAGNGQWRTVQRELAEMMTAYLQTL